MSRWDWPLGLLAGALFALLADLWFAPFHLIGAEVTASDFLDYCAGIVSLNSGETALWPLQRSKLAGALPALLAREVGIMEGLRWSSRLCTAAVGSGLFLWGLALRDRWLGLLVVALALTMGPIVLLPRMLSFYPVQCALMVAGSACTAGFLRRGGWGWALATGMACGLILLVDVRGLIWAGPLAAAAVGWGALRDRWALLALALPLAGSWFAADLAYADNAKPLEWQIDVRPFYHQHGTKHPAFQPPIDYESRFVWGETESLLQLHKTARFLVENSRQPVPDDLRIADQEPLRRQHVVPWAWAAALGGVLAIALQWRRRRVLGALGLSLLPWLAALWGAVNLVEVQPRFLSQALPGVAVLLGVAARLVWDRLPWRRPWHALASGGLLAWGLVFGFPPWPLGPTAGWRTPWTATLGGIDAAQQKVASGNTAGLGPLPSCARQLAKEEAP